MNDQQPSSRVASLRTFLTLHDWFAELADPPELTLLHARFPARRREEITQEILGKFGRCEDCAAEVRCEHRPAKAVVVATQVIEQSLDLDFDLVISDLAPIALLLQRAGRCQRHERGGRPSWARQPRLCVLRPTGDGGLAIPQSWPFVYPRSLLRRTDAELDDGVIAIPGDVQRLVEKVYDNAFASGEMDDDDLEWIGKEMAEAELAGMVAIPEPGGVGGLHLLTSSETNEDLAATRLGAESVRVLCLYPDAAGRLYLDPQLSEELPGGKPTRTQIKKILAETIPLRATLVRERGAENAPPDSWAKSSWLRDLVIVPMERTPPTGGLGRIGDREFTLDERLGLRFVP
jgi:CRISPR-associated endonuclease/helicase Cas3